MWIFPFQHRHVISVKPFYNLLLLTRKIWCIKWNELKRIFWTFVMRARGWALVLCEREIHSINQYVNFDLLKAVLVYFYLLTTFCKFVTFWRLFNMDLFLSRNIFYSLLNFCDHLWHDRLLFKLVDLQAFAGNGWNAIFLHLL